MHSIGRATELSRDWCGAVFIAQFKLKEAFKRERERIIAQFLQRFTCKEQQHKRWQTSANFGCFPPCVMWLVLGWRGTSSPRRSARVVRRAADCSVRSCSTTKKTPHSDRNAAGTAGTVAVFRSGGGNCTASVGGM